jgi:hypothetical protein
MNNLLQHYFITNIKIQFLISNMNIGFQELMIPNFYIWHGYQCFMTTYMLP